MGKKTAGLWKNDNNNTTKKKSLNVIWRAASEFRGSAFIDWDNKAHVFVLAAVRDARYWKHTHTNFGCIKNQTRKKVHVHRCAEESKRGSTAADTVVAHSWICSAAVYLYSRGETCDVLLGDSKLLASVLGCGRWVQINNYLYRCKDAHSCTCGSLYAIQNALTEFIYVHIITHMKCICLRL